MNGPFVSMNQPKIRSDSAFDPNLEMSVPGRVSFANGRPAAKENMAAHASPARSEIDKLIPDVPLDARGKRFRTVNVRKGQDIMICGSHYHWLYVNRSGWLARYKLLHNGSRQIIDFILPGQLVGLSACLFQRALYSVVAITKATLLTIPFDMVDEAFEKHPALAKALFRSAALEGAILGEHLIDAARRSAYQRVSHLLLELLMRLNHGRSSDEMSFSVPLTQELIADALGLTPVHVNRTLRALREDGLIAMDGRSIKILDFEALALLSDFEKSYLGAVGRTCQV
jgi:CRP-like cAMP-binding protein